MTRLQPGQSVTRETAEFERARPLVVRLHAKYLEIWPKGTQQGYTISYDVIFDAARKRAAWSAGVQQLPRVGRYGTRAPDDTLSARVAKLPRRKKGGR